MKPTTLVQRLRRPRFSSVREPWVAALGIPENIWNHITEVFDFDYMGAAEFEFGIITETLKKIALKRAEFRLFSTKLVVPCPNYLGRNAYPPTIHIWCKDLDYERVVKKIESLATNEADCKRPTFLYQALFPNTWRDSQICGWLELDNGFFFFTDLEVANKTVKLFQA